MAAAIQAQDLYVQYQPAPGGTGPGTARAHSGFKAPLTRVVATPCYRHEPPWWRCLFLGLGTGGMGGPEGSNDELRAWPCIRPRF